MSNDISIQISENLALLIYSSNKQNSIILINLDKRYSFKDLGLISRQIYHFSYLGYRSFLRSKKPITVEYSKLLAKALHRLSSVSDWDKNNINIYLLDKPWFI